MKRKISHEKNLMKKKIKNWFQTSGLQEKPDPGVYPRRPRNHWEIPTFPCKETCPVHLKQSQNLERTAYIHTLQDKAINRI